MEAYVSRLGTVPCGDSGMSARENRGRNCTFSLGDERTNSHVCPYGHQIKIALTVKGLGWCKNIFRHHLWLIIIIFIEPTEHHACVISFNHHKNPIYCYKDRSQLLWKHTFNLLVLKILVPHLLNINFQASDLAFPGKVVRWSATLRGCRLEPD